MPYKTIAELPATFGKLPDGAKEIAMNVINSALAGGATEESAFKQAWGAVKKSYEQDADGNWTKIDKEAELETVNIDSVEILAVGKWNGVPTTKEYKRKDLDELVKSFQALTGDKNLNYEPPIKLGHNDGQKMLQADGLPAAGWVRSLKRVGDKLVASLGEVPKKIGDIIKAGGFKKVSSEIYHDYVQGDYKFPLVLKAVALLGGDIPAVKTIADIQAQYGEDEGFDTVIYEFAEQAVNLEDLYSGLDSWLSQAEASIKGKVGSPAIRTFVAEVKARLKALLAKQTKHAEDVNLDGKLNAIRDAFYRQFQRTDSPFTMESPGFIRETHEDYVIIEKGTEYFKMSFTEKDGDIIFDANKAVKVKLIYQEVKDSLVADQSDTGTDTEILAKEKNMLKELRELYGLAEDADEAAVLVAVTKSKTTAEAKGQTVSMSEYEDQKGKVQTLQERIDLKERDDRVSLAIRTGKIIPAQKEWADKYALADPQGFDSFTEAQPVVIKLSEVGGDLNQPGDVGELSEQEVRIAGELGNTAEELLEDKKAELSRSGVN